MKRDDVLQELHFFVAKYGFSLNDIKVIGGAALVLHGLRQETADIDLEVTKEIEARLLKDSSFKIKKVSTAECFLDNGVFDVAASGGYETERIEGVRVQTLKSLLDFKLKLNREKDQKDIAALYARISERN